MPQPGWKMIEVPGQKFKVAEGPILNRWRPQLVFNKDVYKSPLPVYIAAHKKRMAEQFKDYKLLAEKKLKTDAGVEGVVLVIQHNVKGKMLRQNFFYFDIDGEKKLRVTGISPADGGEKLDAVFEASLKTLRLEKP